MHQTSSRRRALLATALTLGALVLACPAPSEEPPPQTLVRLEDEPAGPHCASGGTAIRLGPDANRNGSLDADEVLESQTRYVCHGTDAGVPTPAEYPALVRWLAEPPGPQCDNGGSVVLGGLDRDFDGVLSDSEVTSTHYLCDAFTEAALHFGNLRIESSADLAQLDGVEYVVGDVFIRGDLVPEVHLPRLQRVHGTLTVGWEHLVPTGDGGSLPPLSTLSLPALRSAGNLLLTLPSVRTLDLSALESVGDTLELTSVGQLSAVELPALRSVGGELLFHSTAHFDALPQAFRAPRLTSVTSHLALAHNAQLTEVDLSSLAQAGRLSVEGNASLTALELPALGDVGALTIAQNEHLSHLSLPLLGGGTGTTSVSHNPALGQCTALALEVQRRRAGYLGAFLRSGNLEESACAENTAATCVAFSLAEGTHRYAVCYAERPALVEGESVFQSARADCARAFPGADLAVFETRDELLRLQEAVTGGLALPTSVWLGYSDVGTAGTFAWYSGATGYTPQAGDADFWTAGEPSHAPGEDCVMLLGLHEASGPFVPGYANDYTCSRPLPLLCEVP